MSNENVPLQMGQKRPCESSALTLPPRKKATVSDEWRLKGRHIRRAIHAFANVGQILLTGIQLDKDLALTGDTIEKYPDEIRLQYDVYSQILRFLPQLEEGLTKETITVSELNAICSNMQKGSNNSRSDDVKGLKAAVVVWITDPEKGLSPSIPPDVMAGRGFNHEATGKELCPAGLDWEDERIKTALRTGRMVVASDQWPICFYQNNYYDPQNAWRGLLRGHLLVNGYKHIFTSPSSVANKGRSTKASNSAKHVMMKATLSSIVYVATIVRFSLSDRATFSRTDIVSDSQAFYNRLLLFLSHPDERENVNELLAWWNRQVFPNSVAMYHALMANSPLAMLLEAWKKRAALQVVSQIAN